MMIIGCGFHPSWQQVSWLDTETGENGERKLVQASGDAEIFYRQLPAPALIGMEATGNCHWLVDLLAELGHELWGGRRRGGPACDPASITNTAGAPVLALFARAGCDAADATLWLGTKPRCACVRGSRPLQSAQRTGHPPRFQCQSN
jgi:hypothetical protein